MEPDDPRRKTALYDLNDPVAGRLIIIAVLLALITVVLVVVAIVLARRQSVLPPLLGAVGAATASGVAGHLVARRSRGTERAIRTGPQISGRVAKAGASYEQGGAIPFVVVEYRAGDWTYRQKVHFVAGSGAPSNTRQWQVGDEVVVWVDSENPRRAVIADLVSWK